MDIEGLEIASGTSRYRKILLGVKYGGTFDDFAQKCHGKLLTLLAGSFKSQLIHYSDLPGGYGERVEGNIWQFYDN